MKKVMFALVAVLMAVSAQAAAMAWSTSTACYMKDGTSLFNGTMYLIDAATISQSDLITALKDGGSISDYAITSAAATSGKIAATTLDPITSVSGTKYAGDTSVSFYTVAISGDDVFASASKTVTLSDVGTTKLGFSLSTASKAADAWQSTGGGDVPEPTSGLLLLIGGAMLALRRKQK